MLTCSATACQSPVNEAVRTVQPLNAGCTCDDGWEGTNCNCETSREQPLTDAETNSVCY